MGAPHIRSEMAGPSGRGIWLAASLLLGVDLLCYFGFPLWAGLPPRHPLLPHAAFALLVLHTVGLYYLLRWWLGRGLLRRLAINLSVVAPFPGNHLAVTSLHLLLDIDHRLAVLAPALALAQGKDAVDRSLALEAIRGSDGLLRAWCESARLGTTNG